MVIKYLVGRARAGWERVDRAQHKTRIFYALAIPGGTVIVPVYYGIKAFQVMINYMSQTKGREEEPLKERHLKESNLKKITDFSSIENE
jgi:hypothetical protein